MGHLPCYYGWWSFSPGIHHDKAVGIITVVINRCWHHYSSHCSAVHHFPSRQACWGNCWRSAIWGGHRNSSNSNQLSVWEVCINGGIHWYPSYHPKSICLSEPQVLEVLYISGRDHVWLQSNARDDEGMINLPKTWKRFFKHQQAPPLPAWARSLIQMLVLTSICRCDKRCAVLWPNRSSEHVYKEDVPPAWEKLLELWKAM